MASLLVVDGLTPCFGLVQRANRVVAQGHLPAHRGGLAGATPRWCQHAHFPRLSLSAYMGPAMAMLKLFDAAAQDLPMYLAIDRLEEALQIPSSTSGSVASPSPASCQIPPRRSRSSRTPPGTWTSNCSPWPSICWRLSSAAVFERWPEAAPALLLFFI
jgi:hypothetical protein